MSPGRALDLVREYFWLLIIGGLLVGVLLPGLSIHVYPHLEPLLWTILFLAFLETDARDVGRSLQRPGPALLFALVKLVLLPAAVWYATPFLPTAWRLAALLIAAMPQGVSTPALLALLGADVALGVSFLVVSYALVPFTVPAVLEYLAGTAIALDYRTMTWMLARMIFLPFVAAEAVKRVAGPRLAATRRANGGLSVACIVLLTVGSAAKESSLFRDDPGFVLASMALMFPLFAAVALGGWLAARPLGPGAAQTGMVCATFCNNSLAVVLAAAFFDRVVLALAVLSLIPWDVLQGPAKWLVRRQAQTAPAV